MTTITVTAGDTAQAMDKIVERLGEDALILETVKRNGRIEMIATDDPQDSPASTTPSEPATTAPRAPLDLEIGAGSAFTDLFDQQMINVFETVTPTDKHGRKPGRQGDRGVRQP